MGERKDHRRLTAAERRALVEAVLQLKANGAYDRYVAERRRVFEAGGPARMGSAFLPWHREFLHQFELDLQTIDPTVSLPYWDWTVDRSSGPPLWSPDFLGGGGDGLDDVVTTGPFAFAAGHWALVETSPPVDPGPALRRRLGPNDPLPTPSQVDAVLALTPFDRFVAGLDEILHSSVHAWVGRTMAAATAANDPVFWLHYCNIDRLWAVWQDRHPDQAPYLDGGGSGHRDTFTIGSETKRCRELVNHRQLGYGYDSDLPSDTVTLAIGARPMCTSLGTAGDQDHYQFVVAAAGSYVVETEGAPHAALSLFGPDDPTAVVADHVRPQHNAAARMNISLPAGSYLLRVVHADGAAATGTYSIAVHGRPTPCLPAIPVNGPPVGGRIEAGDESHLYTFAATAPATYTIATAGTTETLITLFGPNNQNARVAIADESGPTRNSCIMVDLAAGLYFVRVHRYPPMGTADYSLSVRAVRHEPVSMGGS